ncbi:hypothetical protein F53441_104 [Fusarium austroafricanum]|uniref:Uncharacterized protein n=1 Tax=Fusarium austroafricanum TaxID=2364996 RepID=A0A8H4KXJ7_9HYPO|nr:hypothetical protein F53441_104 [Fusarium austroafricanum]
MAQPGPSNYTVTESESLPNSSVEPPRVSAFEFTRSPGSAYYYSSTKSAEAWAPAYPQTKVDSLPLGDIPEERKPGDTETLAKDGTGTSSQQDESFNGEKSRSELKPDQGQISNVESRMINSSNTPIIVPREHAVNLETPSTEPEPIDESNLHARLSPQEIEFHTKPREKVMRKPHPRQITPPAALKNALSKPRDPNEAKREGSVSNAATWASPPVNDGSLIPPVMHIPMDSPNKPDETFWSRPSLDSNGRDLVSVLNDTNRQSTQQVPQQPRGSGESSHAVDVTTEDVGFYNIDKPTCSLNLVCYRSNACDLQQVQCILRPKFPSDESFQNMIAANPHLVYNDAQFFDEIRRLFTTQMCGFFRRYFSLKTLREFRVLAYTPTTRPSVVPFDDFVLQEMMFAYRNPGRLESNDDWIQWVFRLRKKDKRHAVEFVEGWNTTRIAIAGTIPCCKFYSDFFFHCTGAVGDNK